MSVTSINNQERYALRKNKTKMTHDTWDSSVIFLR